MSDSVIMERVACAAADCLYAELLRTEDLEAFERIVAADTRSVAAMALGKCVERFDSGLRGNVPRGWPAHERARRTLVTLAGAVAFERTVYPDERGRRRAWADELLGIPPRAGLSACAFLWVASRAAELSYRKAAAEFAALTSAAISHVTVMDVVRREGALLKGAGGELARDGGKVSQDALFMEKARARTSPDPASPPSRGRATARLRRAWTTAPRIGGSIAQSPAERAIIVASVEVGSLLCHTLILGGALGGPNPD